MKKRIKKAIAVLFSMFFAVLSLGMMSGCSAYAELFMDELPTYEEGYFRYAVRTVDGVKYAYIVGLTELGKEQEYLIFPTMIRGYEIADIGYTIDRWSGHEDFGALRSEKLKRLYFPYANKMKNLITGAVGFPNGEIVLINEDSWYGFKVARIVIGYNFYVRNLKIGYYNGTTRKVANVSYMYNFEEAPNGGWYWVDSVNESLIEFIPPNPEREGYMFAGWYREPECVNAWDFDNDITGEEIILEPYEGYDTRKPYPGIYLYAKWIEE